MCTLRASSQGLREIKQARQKGWAIDDPRWLEKASQCIQPNTDWQEVGCFAYGISLPTWKRFLQGNQRIKAEAFKAFCQVLDLNWESITQQPDPAISRFYIERVPWESQCHEEIRKLGALIRIKAPQRMGKTWLLERIINQVENLNYKQLVFDFKLGDSSVFNNIHDFSRFFCASVTEQLNLPNKVNDYWDNMYSCNYNSTVYFQDYLLSEQSPLVLALEQVDEVFKHKQIAEDFCNMLRCWHEKARYGDRTSQIWQRLRLIVVHSTDVYGSVNINNSPLSNVGMTVELKEFDFVQVQDLAQRHGLNWDVTNLERLMDVVGGHPHLVSLALSCIALGNKTLEQVLATAATDSGIYTDRLLYLLGKIRQHPDLARALRDVIMAAPSPVRLESVQASNLYRLGLVKLEGNYATPRCNLYLQYFRDRLNDF